jgi:hypothetical protein
VELVLKRYGIGCRFAWGLGACVLACLGVAACQSGEVSDAEPADPAEVVVAWVDGERIGVEDVLIARRRGGGADLDSRIELAVLDRVASLEARRRKLDQQPKVERVLRDTRRELKRRELGILRAELKKEIVQEVEISEQELRRAYEEDERSYLERQLRLRRWSFESEEQARGALEGVEGADPLDPAQAMEEGPISLRSPPPSYGREMGRLRRPGERVVIQTEREWLVLELAGFVDDAKTPFEVVRDHLQRRLQRDRAEKVFEEYLRELRADADVRIDQSVVSDEELWRRLR